MYKNNKLKMNILNRDTLIFFVYPDPKGSEEPSPALLASSAQPKSIYPPRLRVAASAEQGWGWGN